MVEPVDVFSDSDLEVTDRFPAALGSHDMVADALSFEERVERLGHGVIVRITLGTNGSDCFGKPLGVANRTIVHSTIGIVCQARDALASSSTVPEPHLKGIQDQIGSKRGRYLPADNQTAEDINDERGVDPPGVPEFGTRQRV